MLTTSSYKRALCFLWIILLVFTSVSHAISVKSYSYDKYGNVQEITDPRGFVTKYRYDLLNRLEEIEYPDHKKIKYFYDLSGIRTKMEDHRGTTLFEPDEFGKINKVTFPDGQSVSYHYDPEGNLIKLIYPDGTEVEYTYDLSNRLEAVKDSSGVTKFEYDELSNALNKKILPNGVTTEYQYYKTRKISNVIHTEADGNPIEEFKYFYDENGNRTKIEKISPNGNSHVIYTYDKLGRVVKAEYSNGFFESFSYDGAGNRLSRTTAQGTIIYEYDEENRLKKAGNTIYAYDLAGNLIEKSSPGHKSTYKYDFGNRLIFYADESNQVAFEYDSDGNRISKTVNGVRTDYINDLVAPVSQVLLKRVQGNWWKGEKAIHYVYGGSRICQSTEDSTQFYLYDSMGRNVSALVSSSGKVLNSYEYKAFGGSLSEEQAVPNVYKYCGEQFDEETGLVFLRNRYYDPEIGRFISKDPRPGKLDRPSTLNLYCYVENNPVNFVDPWGFEAIEPEELELVIAHINSAPGWFGGQGIGGHGFLEFPARKESVNPFFGNYPERPSFNEAAHVNAKTVSVAAYCRSKKVDEAIGEMKETKWTARNNCIHTVVEGMKTMEFPHAEKIRLSAIPIPLEFKSQMLKLHERDPVRPLSYPREEMSSVSKASSPLGLNFSPSLDYGGVSLSKAASIHVNIADITGAAFDSSTGQIILFGPENRYLPPVDLDDLAVAVRSVYGIGISHPQDPGVSIDPSPVPGQLQVRYDGATIDTAFGQVMFEADRILKCLGFGKDNITDQPIAVNVPGYANLTARLVDARFTGEAFIRLWFVPDKIELVQSDDHKGMVFSNVRMKVLTESQFNGSSVDSPASRAFVDHFNAHFDDFARQFPIFEKLKTLGKITAIVKWIRENNIPFDVSFLTDYQPSKIETAKYTPSFQSKNEWVTKKVEKCVIQGYRTVARVEHHHAITLTGGIQYSLNQQNFTSYVDSTVNNFASSALGSRPSERDFVWSFRSPANRETFMAVAQSIYRTRKPGNIKKSYVDMSFAVPGKNQLSLQRFYNSFSEKKTDLGRGWRITPYELELPTEKVTVSSPDDQACETYRLILVRTPEGEYLYEPFTFSSDDCPVFKSPHYSGLLKDNLDGTFSLYIPPSGKIDFDQQGKLQNIQDNDGMTIGYKYRDQQLISIQHQNGDTIFLEYDGNRLIEAIGPCNTFVQYTYHPDGQLSSVGDAKGSYFYYLYDSDMRLQKIINRFENVLFEAIYDDYNRAILFKEGSITHQADFSLEERVMKISDSQGRESILRYDDQDRLIFKQDPEGMIWRFAYDQGDIHFPTKIIDPKGGITECHYDTFGNPIYLKDPMGAEWRFFYNSNQNLAAYQAPNGRAVVSLFGSNNRPCQTYLNASLQLNESNRFATKFNGFKAEGAYTVFFTYDKETGQLISRENSNEAKTSFKYHKNGELREIVYPTGYKVEFKVDERGRLVEVTDGFGVQRGYEYDAYGRVKTVRDPVGSTQFTYDDAEASTMILDPRGAVTSYRYDKQEKLKGVTDSENGISSYEYNPQNKIANIILPNGSSKMMKYDVFGRLEQEIWGK